MDLQQKILQLLRNGPLSADDIRVKLNSTEEDIREALWRLISRQDITADKDWKMMIWE